MLRKIDLKFKEFKIYSSEKFQAQDNSLSKIAKDICFSMLKNFHVLLNKVKEEIKKQNEIIEKVES